FPGLPARMELAALDLKANLCPRPEPRPEIVHLDIDDASLRRLGKWPLKRAAHARVLEVLNRCAPALVVYDLVFHGPGEDRDDAALEQAIRDSGRVILPAAFGTTIRDKVIRLASLDEDEAPVVRGLLRTRVPDFKDLHQAKSSFLPLARFSSQALGVGQITALPDPDGVFRRVPLVIGFDGLLEPSIDLLAAMKFLGAVGLAWPEKDTALIELPQGRDIAIPLGPHAAMAVNFAGPWAETFEHISYDRVHDAAQKPNDLEYLQKKLEGRIVLVGLAASGSTDIAATPVSPAEPLATVHANALNTILGRAFIRGLGPGWALLAALGLSSGMWLAWRRLGPGAFLAAGLGLVAAYVLLNLGLYAYLGLDLNLAGVALAGTVAWLALLGQGFVRTAGENLRQRRMLETYFSPQIARQLITTGGALKSASKDLTVLFSDIAGFTTLSDSLHPDAVQKLLMEYFEAMTEIIFQHQGAVDKFMGDGIMAFWGYPEDPAAGPEQNARLSALNAVRAACAMQAKMAELNAKWEAEGWKPLAVRMGLNTGYVTVGNLGSRSRLEFTLIGKNVNLAQRLESSAPEGGILLSSRTYGLVKDRIAARAMGRIKVKGIERPVEVFLVGSAEMPGRA
ncbi:MAG: adenylate/guanylate cyclase domain-containing protein, partial [Desulfovibrionaceae bacterium]|nr:adenylate/guanylate cyclase domain-containing protein [Desulfovibrionaceae bacterium]